MKWSKTISCNLKSQNLISLIFLILHPETSFIYYTYRRLSLHVIYKTIKRSVKKKRSSRVHPAQTKVNNPPRFVSLHISAALLWPLWSRQIRTKTHPFSSFIRVLVLFFRDSFTCLLISLKEHPFFSIENALLCYLWSMCRYIYKIEFVYFVMWTFWSL